MHAWAIVGGNGRWWRGGAEVVKCLMVWWYGVHPLLGMGTVRAVCTHAWMDGWNQGSRVQVLPRG